MIKDKKPIQKGNFTILKDKLIGKGRHSLIYECVDQTGEHQTLCAKIFSNISLPRQLDLQKLKNIENKNVVKYFEIFEHNSDVVIVMEKCEQSLKTKVEKKPLTEPETLLLLQQVMNGYQTLLNNDIELRDLKPANILVKQNTYKLSNFGISSLYKLIEGEARAYSAPEVFYEATQTHQKDIFSLGLILCFSLKGQLPYNYRNASDQVRFLIQIKESGFSVEQETSKRLKYFIEEMLIFNATKRLTWEKLKIQFETETEF